jgi:hypothetical protein
MQRVQESEETAWPAGKERVEEHHPCIDGVWVIAGLCRGIVRSPSMWQSWSSCPCE